MQKTNKKLFFVIFVFIFPVIVSWLLFHYTAYFKLKTLNHGSLLHSPIDVKDLYAGMPNSQEKKWRVLYVTNEKCDTQCQEMNHQLTQVQKALGKDRDRVININMTRMAKSVQLQKLEAQLAEQHVRDYTTANKVYLIDPLGNLFMYYSDKTDPMNILNDLKRVLEVSQIG